MSRQGNRYLLECVTTTRLPIQFQCERGLPLRCEGNVGIPFQTKQGKRPSGRDQWGERTQIKLCQETCCSSRVRPLCVEHFELNQGCKVPFRNTRGNGGILLRCCSVKGSHLAMPGEPRGFSRVGQNSPVTTVTSGSLSCSPGKSNLHSSCEGELGFALE